MSKQISDLQPGDSVWAIVTNERSYIINKGDSYKVVKNDGRRITFVDATMNEDSIRYDNFDKFFSLTPPESEKVEKSLLPSILEEHIVCNHFGLDWESIKTGEETVSSGSYSSYVSMVKKVLEFQKSEKDFLELFTPVSTPSPEVKTLEEIQYEVAKENGFNLDNMVDSYNFRESLSLVDEAAERYALSQTASLKSENEKLRNEIEKLKKQNL